MGNHGQDNRARNENTGPIRRGAYPELTWTAIFVGWFLGAIIAFSIGYAALILGFSIEGSELAAILGWGILRGILRRSSIVENNINQTIASAVNGASSGMMFSVPALYILARSDPEAYGAVTEYSWVLMILACITGGIIGLAFIIPLRKQMIDFNRLAYPGGIAVATILKSPGAGLKKVRAMLLGAAISGGFYTAMLFLVGDHPAAHAGEFLGLPTWLNLTFFLSLMTVGVGFLSGRGGMVFGYGGFICYFVLAPLLIFFGSEEVKKMIDVPPRQAIVENDNSEAVEQAAVALEAFDPETAAQLRTALGTSALASPGEDPGSGESRLVQTEADLTSRILFDSAAIKAIDDARSKLEEQANRIRPSEPEKSKELEGFATSLATSTRTAEIGEAITILAANGALEEGLRTATSARETSELIRDAPGLSDEQRSTLLAATRAKSLDDGVPTTLRLELFRPTGIGMLIGAAIAGIIAAFPLITSAVRSMQRAAKERGSMSSDEMPIKLLYVGIIGGAAALVMIAFLSVDGISLGRGLLVGILGTLWIWVAGVIVSECLGRTNWSPLSGMTLIAVTILILITGNLGSTSAVICSVIVGAAICVAISQAGDMMLDLKSGYLVGASPKMQQYAQYLGTWLGPILILGLVLLLENAYELGSSKLPAPQGQALASVIQALIGGDVPAWRYLAGAGLGAMLAFSGLGGIGVMIGLGFYMPFDIVLTYTVGCLLRIAVQSIKGRDYTENVGIPFAAGLIVGEALIGVGNAFYQILIAG